jgi:phage terminase small subunit
MTLSPKQQRFVAEYLIDLNATQAAIRAGYSRKTAEQQGYENLRKPQIAAAVGQAQAAHNERAGLDAEDGMRVNAAIVRFDPIALVDDAGNYRPLRDIPAAARGCIKRIRVHKVNLTTGDGRTDRVLDYEFYNKHPAIERDYKRHGLLVEKVELSGQVTLAEKIARARARLAERATRAK